MLMLMPPLLTNVQNNPANFELFKGILGFRDFFYFFFIRFGFNANRIANGDSGLNRTVPNSRLQQCPTHGLRFFLQDAALSVQVLSLFFFF